MATAFEEKQNNSYHALFINTISQYVHNHAFNIMYIMQMQYNILNNYTSIDLLYYSYLDSSNEIITRTFKDAESHFLSHYQWSPSYQYVHYKSSATNMASMIL